MLWLFDRRPCLSLRETMVPAVIPNNLFTLCPRVPTEKFFQKRAKHVNGTRRLGTIGVMWDKTVPGWASEPSILYMLKSNVCVIVKFCNQ